MRRLLFSLIWNLVASNAISDTLYTLTLRGVDIMEIDDGSLDESISVELQCGETLRGVLVREADHTIGLGAIIARPNLQCASAPTKQVISLNFLAASAKELTSLPSDEGDHKISFQEVDVTSNKNTLKVTWENSCKKFYGIVLAPSSDKTVEVAAAFAPSKQKLSTCPQTRMSSTLNLDLDAKIQFSSMKKPSHLRELYALRVVAPQQIDHVNGKLTLTFQKNCKELPVGILSTGAAGYSLGVITAYFPNITCTTDTMNQTSSYSLTSTLYPLKGSSFKAISQGFASQINSQSYMLTLKVPTAAKFSSLDATLQMTSDVSSNEIFGTVLGEDSSANLSVASLALPSNTGKMKVGKRSTTIPTPFQHVGVIPPKAFPLKVRGSLVR